MSNETATLTDAEKLAKFRREQRETLKKFTLAIVAGGIIYLVQRFAWLVVQNIIITGKMADCASRGMGYYYTRPLVDGSYSRYGTPPFELCTPESIASSADYMHSFVLGILIGVVIIALYISRDNRHINVVYFDKVDKVDLESAPVLAIMALVVLATLGCIIAVGVRCLYAFAAM